LPEKTTFLTLPMWKFLKQKKTIYQTFRQKKKKNKERNSYSVHETGKKVFFSNIHGFAVVPLDTIFNVVFFNGSFRTVLCGGLKSGRSKKKS